VAKSAESVAKSAGLVATQNQNLAAISQFRQSTCHIERMEE
jgi:hypothetical protein